jgi:hypothetical protein
MKNFVGALHLLLIAIVLISCKKEKPVLIPPFTLVGTIWEAKLSINDDLTQDRMIMEFTSKQDVLLTLDFHRDEPLLVRGPSALKYTVDSLDINTRRLNIDGRLNSYAGVPGEGYVWRDVLIYRTARENLPETLGNGQPYYFRIK